MPRQFRILISSAGRRVALIECFRQAASDLQIELEVLACDLDPDMSAACQLADRRFQVPRCEDAGFGNAICNIATEHHVDLIIPTIDPELMPLTDVAMKLASSGVRVHVNPAAVIEVVRDKLRTAQVLAASGVPVPKTATPAEVSEHPEQWAWPLFMKPAGGSASRGLQIINGPEDIPSTFDEPMIIQELLTGPEYTVNVFVDRDGVLRCVIPHQRLRVRAGEVEKGRTVRNPLFSELAAGIVRALPAARGVMCFQVIVDPTLGPQVFEINARFGGGYPLADHAGGTFARWLLEETAGRPSSAHDNWREGVEMLRYDAAFFRG